MERPLRRLAETTTQKCPKLSGQTRRDSVTSFYRQKMTVAGLCSSATKSNFFRELMDSFFLTLCMETQVHYDITPQGDTAAAIDRLYY